MPNRDEDEQDGDADADVIFLPPASHEYTWEGLILFGFSQIVVWCTFCYLAIRQQGTAATLFLQCLGIPLLIGIYVITSPMCMGYGVVHIRQQLATRCCSGYGWNVIFPRIKTIRQSFEQHHHVE